ncbi:MAG: cupin domain-containing protein [Nitrospinae bacterium]|nr:cupin domain-containing protein [Nitrospinota bacterium]
MEIKVEKLKDSEIKERGINSWPIWEKETSKFPWHYDSTEECYLLEGEVIVEDANGNKVQFGKGDFVTLPEGLSCNWEIKKPVRKYYNFK